MLPKFCLLQRNKRHSEKQASQFQCSNIIRTVISGGRNFASHLAHPISYCQVGFLLYTDAFIVCSHPTDMVNEVQRTSAVRFVNSDIYKMQEWANAQLVGVWKCAFRLITSRACQETLRNPSKSYPLHRRSIVVIWTSISIEYM